MKPCTGKRAGSQAAFATLYARYEAPLFGFIRRRLGNVQDAEEVFHDAMLAVLKGPEAQVESSGSFAAWLYRVAANRASNFGRARLREVSVKQRFQVASQLHEETIPRPDLSALDRERLNALGQASGRLSRILSDVLELRFRGHTTEEIAAILRVPTGTVKSRLHTLVTQLRKDLRQWFAP